MIGTQTVLGLIPARGGSKGVLRKNIREVGGKPLIAWTIEAAKASRYIDRIVLSSDDQSIIDVALSRGCEVPFVRPRELATDETDSMQVIRHAIVTLPERYDLLVLLQPTSPMRLAEDIDGAIERFVQADAAVCLSVSEPDKSPFWMLKLCHDGDAQTLFPIEQIPARRQDAPPVVAINGALYVARSDYLADGGTYYADRIATYPMPKARSFDIDTELDLKIVDFLLRKSDGKIFNS